MPTLKKRGKAPAPVQQCLLSAIRKTWRGTALEMLNKGCLPLNRFLTIQDAFAQGFQRDVPILEQTFSKEAGKKPVGSTKRKYVNAATIRRLRAGAKFLIQPHSKSARPTLSDLSVTIHYALEYGKLCQVIACFDYGRAQQYFSEKQNDFNRFSGKPPQGQKRFAVEAAKRIAFCGKTYIMPTKDFWKLSAEKKVELDKYLNKEAEKESQKGTFLYAENAEKRQSAINNHILKKYGRVFSMRFVPAKGYKFDKTQGAFVKA